MKFSNLGIDAKTGLHDKRLTTTESRFLGILWMDHVRQDKKIAADELAVRFDCAMKGEDVDSLILARVLKENREHPGKLDKKKRLVRRLHNHLLTMHDNIAILSKAGAGGGYWITERKEEAAEFYETFRRRGMTGLVKASRGKKAILVDMMEQLTFEFEDMAINITGMSEPADGDPAAIAVVDSFLARMLDNPEKFSAGLKKLSVKYGSVLLDKTELEAMKAKAAELSRLVESL